MSYDIHLEDPVTGYVLHTETEHHLAGGNYVVGGTTELWLNITWNYANHFYRTMGKDGVRAIYGKTGEESIPILTKAIRQLSDDIDEDYWASTEGNAKQALCKLRVMAYLRPDGVWNGD